jgi:hypothetical protein
VDAQGDTPLEHVVSSDEQGAHRGRCHQLLDRGDVCEDRAGFVEQADAIDFR